MCAILVVSAMAGLLLLIDGLLRAVSERSRRKEGSIATRFVGYPAPESEVTPGRFYQCKASIVEMHPSVTNYFVVLVEMTPSTNGLYRMIGTNRFFGLSHALLPGAIYISGQAGSNLVWKQVGEAPQPPEAERPAGRNKMSL